MEGKDVRLFVKRLDLIHPLASGNKFYKLKYNLETAQQSGHDTVLTFGGAFSNHIFATAAAAKAEGLKSIGIIRGENTSQLNATLQQAQANGMVLSFMDRKTYRTKHEAQHIDQLREQFGRFFLIPEGGTNALAIKGTTEILTSEDQHMDYLCCSIGTGGTIAGMINAAKPHQKVLGFSSLKGNFIHQELLDLLETHHIGFQNKYELFTNYHFGGYAKHKPELITFIKKFKKETGIPLDPVYTGKLFYGVVDKIKSGYFPSGSSILLIHSGGLQGISGFNQRFNETLETK
ncbi:1-aminocyclopropane-1-carboxylate deaminase/D-cysteine desulfhydrase [Echinicola soli]|uniref:1-aminocyclopropane-1-carboxylate deaminase/D-cysteine desulfhydrase n=2 Tax=Echinicola soli TaxID=2591634 RepID=A0A514CNS8_9BACT|nr:1-aminocyclopropane-1-carboxylate deaminase/D-cysteine desulfhydrase [Echinicola soli]